MPGEVPEQSLGLVAGPDREGRQLRGLVEQDDHPLAGHHVAAPRRVRLGFMFRQVSIGGCRDFDRARVNPELFGHEAGVLRALRVRGAVRHQERVHVVGPESPGAQRRGHGRVDTARQSDHRGPEPSALHHLLLQETHEPLFDEGFIDREQAGIARPPCRHRPVRRVERRLRRSTIGVRAVIRLRSGTAGVQKSGKRLFEVRQHRKVHAGGGDLAQVELDELERLFPQGPLPQHVAAWAARDGSSGEPLSALEPEQLRHDHGHSMLFRRGPGQPLPPFHVRGATVARLHPPRRRGAAHDQGLGSVECREHRRDGMEHVLADQHRRAAPSGVERADRVSCFDEPLLLKHPVGREKDLAVHVHQPRLRTEFCVQRGVVDPMFEFLEEPDHDIYGAVGAGGPSIPFRQPVEQRVGTDRVFPDASLEEVPGERRLGKHDHVRGRVHCLHASEHVFDPRQGRFEVALTGAELGNRDAEEHELPGKKVTGSSVRNVRCRAPGVNRVANSLLWCEDIGPQRNGRCRLSGDLIAIGAAVVLLVGIPALTLRGGLSDEQLDDVGDARSAVYASASLSLMFLASLFFLVALWRDLPSEVVGWQVGAAGPAFLWAAATAVAGLIFVWLVVRIGAKLGLSESGMALALMPRSGREIRGFLMLAGAAAVCEEYLFRGFAQGVIGEAIGSPWPAVGLASVSFGISHGYQRLIGIVRATLLGALLALPVVWTGSLFPAIVAHFWINAVIGIGGWKYLYPEALPHTGGIGTNRES